MSQTTGRHRDLIDQFYTSEAVARHCVCILRKHVTTPAQWIEPSAGNGVFLRIVAGSIGYDIDPKDDCIQRADFLQVEIPQGCIVFGNPPFGRQSSLAKQFIRHAAKKADWIGFILPRSFVKPSMQSAFPLHFHLKESVDLPENAFLVNDVPYNVPCVFQVWKREDADREVAPRSLPIGFTFVKKTDTHSFAFRRVGINAGKCCLPSETLSFQSHYFIQLEDEKHLQRILATSQTHVFPTNTTGPRSLSKHEATCFLHDVLTR